MIIKKNNLNDCEIKKISKMEKDFFYPNNYEYSELKKMNEANFIWFLFIDEKNNSLLGYAIVFDSIDFLEIYKIAVDKYHRDNKIGTTIINEIKKEKKNILIEVSDKDSLKYFYIKNDFQEYGFRESYYCDGSNAILMEWKIS